MIWQDYNGQIFHVFKGSKCLKNVRLVEEADVDSHIIPKSLADSWAFYTVWQHGVHTFTKKRTFPWYMVFPDINREKTKNFVVPDAECGAMYCWTGKEGNFKTPDMFFSACVSRKSNGWISLLRYPHLIFISGNTSAGRNHCRYLLCLSSWEGRFHWRHFVFPVDLNTPRDQ